METSGSQIFFGPLTKNEDEKIKKERKKMRESMLEIEIEKEEEMLGKMAEEERAKKRKIGATYILNKYPNMGFTKDGARDALVRLRSRGAGRKAGSGRRRWVRNAEKIDEVKKYTKRIAKRAQQRQQNRPASPSQQHVASSQTTWA